MTVPEKIKSYPIKELPFYNKYIEKPKIKCLRNIDLLSELPFYKELNVIKTDHVFKGYAMSYKVALVEKKDPINLLEAYNQALKICLKTLDEIKGFKYQITVKALLRKDKQNGEIEFAPVYFNSTTKTVINHKFDLDKSFQEILYKIDNWINEGSDWIIE